LSSIGSKSIVGITGLMLVGFLLAHLSGNLLIFAGPQAINGYAESLRTYPAVLWGLRLGLIAIFLVHVSFAIVVNQRNRRARPDPYKFERTVQASWASRHMVLSGAMVFIYVIYHLAHYTFRVTNEELSLLGPYDVYQMLVMEFRNPLVTGTYLMAMVFMGLHLYHALVSVLQTFGGFHPKYICKIRILARLAGVFIPLIYSSVPIAIALGFIK
jgi:succinate dehydrogenase / fumarate reductase, cytochrome b subunit